MVVGQKASAASVASPIRCRRLCAAIGAERKAHRAANTERIGKRCNAAMRFDGQRRTTDDRRRDTSPGPAGPRRDERRQSMTFDWSVIWTHRQALLEGAALTIALTVLTMLLAVPGGIVLALMRLSPNRLLQRMSLCFVEFFRNLPLILVIYWAFYVMPMATGLQMSPLATALVALVLNISAYNAETFRAGINSIRKGQLEAALAMGMSRHQALRKVVIPQATRR